MFQAQGSPRGETMLTPEEVAAMARLHALGWGSKRIADEVGCSRNTVKQYLAPGSWVAFCRPRRRRRLDGLKDWLAERFRRHRGNCDVVRQDLLREHGIAVSPRTVERAVAPLRREARACVRLETAPGQQLQIDFSSTTVAIGGAAERVHLFVATLGYSRRSYVRAFRHERQSAWFDGVEARSSALARCRGRCCLITRGRWSIIMTWRAASYVSMNVCTPLPGTRSSDPGSAHRIGRAPRARTNTASVTSRATPLPLLLCELGGVVSASGVMDVRDRRPAHPWHHRRNAAAASSGTKLRRCKSSTAAVPAGARDSGGPPALP